MRMKTGLLFPRTAARFISCLIQSADYFRFISTTSLHALSPAESVMTQR